ncbi:site-2 protease family protein [Candidatus Poribacteria bacterium]|nr:site-2 protease family protein [Candidatus Poribacteria bacterium]MYG07895.1 site-2 protease family protein [Candidatus Poribacteria bacterium]MYK21047.1 site-2 protease family protein [Candidatus Poribacteria bacterium]
MANFDPFAAILLVTQFIVLLTFHEWGHAKSANMLGDPTARDQGRMTLNPGVHIDMIGTIILPLIASFFGGAFFGWAKPVPVNPYNLKNPRRDLMLIAGAGPFMNIVLTFVILGAVKLLVAFTSFDPTESALHFEINRQLLRMGLISIFLAAFNMLPLFPLDGFSVVRGLLPEHLARGFEKLMPYGMPILMCLIFLPSLLGIPNYIFEFLNDISYTVFNLIGEIVGLR